MTKLKKCFLAWLLPILITLGLLGYSAKVYAFIIDFAVGPPHPGTAKISYAGGVNPLVGVDLSVFNVVGLGTPSNPNVTLTIVGGALNFTTGSLTGSDANTWYFGGGGSITVTGGIDLNPNPGLEIPLGSTLLTGTFTSASVTNLGGGSFSITGSSFTDSKDQQLTDFYGLPNFLYYGNFNISFFVIPPVGPPNSFTSSSVLSGDIVNTPEPATMLLFGGGLVGIGIFARRKFHRT